MSSAAENIIHEDLEPGVIDANMIIKSVLDHSPKGELGRLIAERGITLEEITELRLEFLNILRIDHLWMLDSLVVLHISNNLIEKIENLEKLVNLKELDLSFNNIEVIENLGTLVHLEILTLFQNKISKLENLQSLRLLQIFSVGNNELDDLENVLYLRPFSKLRALNMAGNPIAKEENFKDYIFAFLPQLVYYEYRMISQAEREVANVKLKDERKRLLGDEPDTGEDLPEIFEDVDKLSLYESAFVSGLDEHFFNSLFKYDPEGVTLLKMNEESEELFIDFKDKFLAVCKELIDVGVAEYAKRKQEMDEYDACVLEAKATITEKSRDMLNDFIERKTEIFYQMRIAVSYMQAEAEGEDEENSEEHEVNLRRLAAEFLQLSHYIWQELMRMEMTLYEQIDEVTSNFEVNLREMLTQFSEGSQVYFGRIRDEDTNYLEQLSDLALRFHNNLNIRLGDITFVIDPDLKDLLADREVMTSTLNACREIHSQLMDDKQDAMTSKIAKWADEYFDKLKTDEIKRNRGKIVETSHFMDLQQEEYDEILAATDIHFDEPFLGEGDGFDVDMLRQSELGEEDRSEKTEKPSEKDKKPVKKMGDEGSEGSEEEGEEGEGEEEGGEEGEPVTEDSEDSKDRSSKVEGSPSKTENMEEVD